MDNDNSSNPSDQEMSDEEFVASIMPYVMGCLKRDKFFEALDDHFSPRNSSRESAKSQGDFNISTSILQELGYEEARMGDVFEVLKSKGGFCDCEILYNVAEESQLKTKHWQAQHKRLTARKTREPHQ